LGKLRNSAAVAKEFANEQGPVENREGQELFSVALKAGLLLFYVITKGRAATFSDIEIFL
jgi:hypothetical protein